MALPRPLLLALLGLALIATALVASTRLRAGGDEELAEAPRQPAAAAQPAAAGKVTSGVLRLRLGAELGAESFSVAAGGPFASHGATRPPSFDFEVRIRADGANVRTGAVSTGERAYLTLGERAYDVPPELWEPLRGARARIAEHAPEGAAAQDPAQALGVDPSAWTRGLRRERAQLDGVPVERVSGEVDPKRALDQIEGAMRSGLAGSAPTELPAEVREQVLASITAASVELVTGRDDGILRRLRLRLEIDTPRRYRDAASEPGRGSIDFEISLGEVNRPQRIEAPAGARALPARELGDRLGDTPGTIATALLGAGVVLVDTPPGYAEARAAGLDLSTGGATPSAGAASAGAVPDGLPPRLAGALRRRDVVVLAFMQRGGVDDSATREALKAVRGDRGVTVVTAGIDDVARFRPVVGNLGVNQAPAIVLVRRDGKAELLEGYVDPGTLAQEVSDARAVPAEAAGAR